MELHVSAPFIFFFKRTSDLTFQRWSSSLVSLERFPLPPLEKTTAPERSDRVKDKDKHKYINATTVL